MLTCIRNQGQRGTCHNFAAISAIEELIARDTGVYVNLSEQDFMENTKLVWATDYYQRQRDAGDDLHEHKPPATNSPSKTPGTTIRRRGQPSLPAYEYINSLRRLSLERSRLLRNRSTGKAYCTLR